MGLSKIGPANQHHTILFTNVAGTSGYCDPQYMETYTLTKELDIYSFGVVLFEVLCGRLCFKYTNNQLWVLVPMWKQSYTDKILDQIIIKDLTRTMNPASLETFSDIAFQCLQNSRKQRPAMSLLVEKLRIALKFQEFHDMKLTNGVGTSNKDRYIDEMRLLLLDGKGNFVNRGITADAAAPQMDAAGEARVKHLRFDGSMGLDFKDYYITTDEITEIHTLIGDHKATSKNGDEVAIKRLNDGITKRHTEFEVGLNLLGKIRHPNLLAIRDCFLAEGVKLLVFDYLPKGSLTDVLHTQRPKTHLDWPTRMQIAKGVARGLLSLHTHYNIVHEKLTSINVLLDENFNLKISDFGMSLLLTGTAYSITIETVQKLGYQAPEVCELNINDMKADVYSLGVIMLELLTGKSPGNAINGLNLPKWAAFSVKQGWIYEVFDHELMKDASTVAAADELVNSLNLALQCVQQSPQDRPDVQSVLQQL